MVRKRGRAVGHGVGVADYFAILGMHLGVDDSSSLRPPSDAQNLDAIDVVDNDHGVDDVPIQRPASDDGDNTNAIGVELPSSAAADSVEGDADDGGGSASLSSSLSELEHQQYSDMRTPRNTQNLSKKHPAAAAGAGAADVGDGDKQRVTTDAEAVAVEVGSNHDLNADAEEERRVHRLYEERFQREIVEVALISSCPKTTSGANDGGWTIAKETEIPVIIPHGQKGRNNSTVAMIGRRSAIITTKVHLAYRRRYHQQYIPGVADIAMHHVRVRPSTIFLSPHPPNDESVYSERNTNDALHTTTTISTATTMAAPPNDYGKSTASSFPSLSGGPPITSPSRSGVSGVSSGAGGGGAAKQLSYLARQGMEKLTAAAVSYAIKQKQGAGKERSREHFFPDVDVNNRRRDVVAAVANAGIHCSSSPQCREEVYFRRLSSSHDANTSNDEDKYDWYDDDGVVLVPRAMCDFLPLPNGYDEWIIPDFCEKVHLPAAAAEQRQISRQQQCRRPPPRLVDRTHSGSRDTASSTYVSTPSSVGMEAMYLSPMNIQGGGNLSPVLLADADQVPDPDYVPSLVPFSAIPNATTTNDGGRDNDDDDAYIYIPILALRRQRIGEEERYHEDPSVVDIYLTHLDDNGLPSRMMKEDEDDDGDDDCGRGGGGPTTHTSIISKSGWKPSSLSASEVVANEPNPLSSSSTTTIDMSNQVNLGKQRRPVIYLRRNIPNGFADMPIVPAKVLDRFPRRNYRNMPFPEEELPLFCYPRGGVCLVRDTLRNWPLPKSFGFVVKNERGDNIYVSCLTFLEPVTKQRMEQLDQLSMKRRDTSLAHRTYCEKCELALRRGGGTGGGGGMFGKDCLVGFDDIVTYENKTICLLGRYPYWTEFRKFLTHLHLLSGSSSDIPLERNISHLLLSVPMPKPGGQCVLVPFSTMNEPMALVMPPLKDFPLVDLSYSRLFAALDVPTVVTIVLGFLCLERKVILISTRQSLLLDCCELLKSLLFPFELCAPYVPHLTQPFMSCLEFPGAIFVGIHDDGYIDGLARTVRSNIPEESIIVELDSGEINCDTNRYETLKAAYQIIPTESRSVLIKELEALCQDAGIVPGQEPLDFGIDSACQVIESTVPSSVEVFGKNKLEHHVQLDERAVRDSFLRYFTSILTGYERFLVVPDADFLTSGNDWFDSSKFVAASSPSRTTFLRALVETQLFQSFVQRRTESSDVHCALFDECATEYHSTTVPYGRLSGNVNQQILQGDLSGHSRMDYDLLVDQCATEPYFRLDDDVNSFLARSDVNKSVGYDNETATQASETTISDTPSIDKDTPFAMNASGDIVTCPSTAFLPPNARYVYCIDGNGCFPIAFDQNNFFPREPDILEAESSEAPAPILTRSDRERDESSRLFNMTVSRRGVQKQHRCLWQMAKFMGSQFFGAYILCIPAQISQPNLSVNEKSKILLRSLGALRILRSHRRIVADEAAYRALIVACGRCGTDRRTELTKLYGLMRLDGIFMNAVTLGCYTRSIAEGYSNMNIIDGIAQGGMQVFTSSGNNLSKQHGFGLEVLDSNLSILEESGVRWRSGGKVDPQNANECTKMEQNQPLTVSLTNTFDTTNTQRSNKTKRSWLPVTCSSSFPQHFQTKNQLDLNDIRLFALWSRTTSCNACGYIPLDEEIQSGWDVITNKLDNSSIIACPRCGGSVLPLIGYREMSIVQLELEAAERTCEELDISGLTLDTDPQELPPQLESIIKDGIPSSSIEKQEQESGFVTYLSPQKLRILLEDLVLEYGKEALNRDSLRVLSPEVFFNLWWYSTRFSLPLPLSTSLPIEESNDNDKNSKVDVEGKETCRAFCAFASWDKSVALHGCRSASKAVLAAQTLSSTSDRLIHDKLLDNPYTDVPLLSFFNLQNYAQGDWDHPDFSEILVALVKACETRDLLPVVECVIQRNQHRETMKQLHVSASLNNLSFESASTTTFTLGQYTEASTMPVSIEMDCYRTILYLARYQCTTAFHAFFPTTTKPCKGFHFWCAQGTAPMPIFDRAFREAAETYRNRNKLIVPIQEISCVALGFRSVFGHII